ncbi:MAG: DUF4262 domain-containing protein [Pseudomonadota bacterium]|uniref:DUF4262 domain-containing protein n=1 Tax=Alteromonas sp. 009811495 TaxID=3002962 RepID=UPI00237E9288|nr:DUF4262 domain-containing protein [Alteromonas sp. 009811495]WDT84386.1 DUF4262 domain-containing protein [Alteromonas sp. 009811495]
MNEAEIKIMENISTYGCHVTSVFDPKEQDPNFTYTTGINRQESRPELIIVGLRSELSSLIANEYNRRIQEGEVLMEDGFYEGFLDGFEVCFKPVANRFKEEFMLSCNWLYEGTTYPALQLVYPTVDGIWPWEAKASDSFKLLQPSFQETSAW